jgi:uncharacterized protein YndB with AHSA1/START domain
VPESSGATSKVEHEIRIEASPETVFGFFTDPVRMVQWMGNEATLDPRPGGVFQVAFVRDIGQVAARGEFVEIVPFERIVFTWGIDAEGFGVPSGSTRVEVSLVSDGAGTVVRLAHTELPGTAVEFHSAGWGHYLERLAVVAAGTDLGSDDWIAPGVIGSDG